MLNLIGQSDRGVIPRWIANDPINDYVFQALGIESNMATRAAEHEIEQAIGESFPGHASHSGGGDSFGGDAVAMEVIEGLQRNAEDANHEYTWLSGSGGFDLTSIRAGG